MNLSKELKKKRDAERRLDNISPSPSYVGSGGTPSTGGGTVEGDTYITNETIINEIYNVINNQLIAGDNITIVDNLDGTHTISGEAGEVVKRDLLTNGSLIDTELLFADGDVIWVEV